MTNVLLLSRVLRRIPLKKLKLKTSNGANFALTSSVASRADRRSHIANGGSRTSTTSAKEKCVIEADILMS